MDVLKISRTLSYSVIILSFCMKLPQILSVYRAKSSRGLNIRGYWMEIACYIIGASFGYITDLHISTYGESILLATQSAVIIFLTAWYGRKWNLENLLFTVLFGLSVFIAASLVKAVPEVLLRLLLLSTLPLAAASKLSQIKELYQLKTQGDVSALMWGLAAYGCAARLFTVIVEVKDPQIFMNFLISMILNTVVVFQCLYYGNAKKL